MNLIFLDVDGVLNSSRKLREVWELTHKPHSGVNYPFDERCMNNLKLLVEKTNSKIVVTSTWRKYEENRNRLLEELKKYELNEYVIGYTKVFKDNPGIEIGEYLKTLDKDVNFIILDDSSKMGVLVEYLVKTDISVGLTYENVEEAIKKLTKRN